MKHSELYKFREKLERRLIEGGAEVLGGALIEGVTFVVTQLFEWAYGKGSEKSRQKQLKVLKASNDEETISN